jgi:hypothetical protein
MPKAIIGAGQKDLAVVHEVLFYRYWPITCLICVRVKPIGE